MFSFIDTATLKSYLRRFPSVIFFVLLISSVYLCINLLRDGSDRMAITFGAIQLGGDPFEQWYQVTSYIFVETGGFFHFIVILMAILFIAPPLERVYGSVKFTLLFIVTGMIGGSFLFTLPLDDVVGGAGISLLGLVGLQIGLLLRGKSMMNSNHSLFMWLSVFSIVAYTYAFPQFPLISYLSSLISGLVFSVIVQPQSFAQLSKSNPYIAMLQTVFVIGMLFFMLFFPMYLTEPTNRFGDVTQHVKDRLDTVSTFKDEQLDRVSSLFDSSNRASAIEEEEPSEENEAEQIDHMVVAAELLGEGEPDLAIAELKKVKKSSAEYEEAQYQIETINLNLYLEQPMETDYKELQKRTDHYKGSTVHFYGKIYNIQEFKESTIFTLSTHYDSYTDDYIGDEALILFHNTFDLNEGDYLHIYGEMVGSYASSQQTISQYTNSGAYSIYFDQRTFMDQAPVIKTKILFDDAGTMYEGD